MILNHSEALPITMEQHIVVARQVVRGFGIVDQTKLVTAASELARNTLIYGGGGQMRIERLQEGSRKGLRLHFIDEGPGIPDIVQALTDGWTSGSGLGLGLSGAKRLVNDFAIESEVGKGTRVTVTRWK
jgi:serine/threonine-protein kinase RsbT